MYRNSMFRDFVDEDTIEVSVEGCQRQLNKVIVANSFLSRCLYQDGYVKLSKVSTNILSYNVSSSAYELQACPTMIKHLSSIL